MFTGNETICHKCGKLQLTKNSDFETYCRRCTNQSYDSARAVGVYENAISASVLTLKKESAISKRLGGLILESFDKTNFQDAARIIPVPLARARFLERGFNQSVVIARLLSKHAKIPIDARSLVRIGHSKIHRAGMDRRGRELSVEKSFKISRKISFEDENILLVDDVLTSGATVSACAKTLKKNGASKVCVFTIARAV